MSKRILAIFLSVVLVLSALSQFSFSALAKAEKTNGVFETKPIAAASTVSGIVTARFENMLSLNYLYGEDFSDDKTVIENSILSLINYAQDGEIEKDLVINFIANMYGLSVDENAAVYSNLPVSTNKFAVIPRGYSFISHEILSVTENDGGYVVLSNMTVTDHDGGEDSQLVETVFVANVGSYYGYNIISSDFVSGGNRI